MSTRHGSAAVKGKEKIINCYFAVMLGLKACCHSDVLAHGRFQAACYLQSHLAKL